MRPSLWLRGNHLRKNETLIRIWAGLKAQLALRVPAPSSITQPLHHFSGQLDPDAPRDATELRPGIRGAQIALIVLTKGKRLRIADLPPEAVIGLSPTVTDGIEVGKRETQTHRRLEGPGMAVINRLIQNAKSLEPQGIMIESHNRT